MSKPLSCCVKGCRQRAAVIVNWPAKRLRAKCIEHFESTRRPKENR